jgi:hypothetical protein
VVAAIVDEAKVQSLREGLRAVAWDHLGWVPSDFEFHGYEIWSGFGYWKGKSPAERIAAYDAALAMLDVCDIDIAHASINKAKLHTRYGGDADDNAYRLALQFLLEKIDAYGSARKIVVADEAKEQEVRAVKMVGEMQDWAFRGEVPGRKLGTIIDCLHFVSSHDSAGVQIADLIAYVMQRRRRTEAHPDARAAIARYGSLVDLAAVTGQSDGGAPAPLKPAAPHPCTACGNAGIRRRRSHQAEGESRRYPWAASSCSRGTSVTKEPRAVGDV